ncbi:MAG: cache domain-containing protein, partial [Desulfuromusa sp.]|nr:cache domain-containing protein [Desulfuromusa sp.]
MQKKKVNLIRMFQLITIAAVVLVAVIISLLNISTQSEEFEQRIETMRANYVEQQKTEIKREVERVVDSVKMQLLRSEEETQVAVKQRVLEAFAIAENIYQQNKSTKSKNEIQQMIVNVLRNIRFAQGSGYYFITRLDGTEVLFADKPELEGV